MVAIRSLETAVPQNVVRQDALRDLFASQPAFGRLGKRLVTAAFDASAIETRHTVLDELVPGAGPEHPAFLEPGAAAPGTGARNAAYVAHAGPLALEAARKTLASSGAQDLTAQDVTHVITVSCTGFSAPGVDLAVAQGLRLAPSTQRLHLGFMGCYAAFPALRAAQQFCLADPAAVVLVVCVELCSLHLHVTDDTDTIVANSVFADGAAAALVTARPAPVGTPLLELDAFESALVPEGESEMAWTIGDQGFDMVLSTYVPRLLEQNIGEILKPLLARDARLDGRAPASVDRWAVHPGGRSILDRVQTALELSEGQLADSRDVLREYGNMSSATILFVLRRILLGAVDGPERVAALAFGPGLTVESALMTLRRQPATIAAPRRPAVHRQPVRQPTS
ncbi:naringenin-chalcone synthase [Frondihabitans sucicola]|uniref:Naringenin-chalcone synthase n=1 Tax=Frondihabitans sucicola TaxID=1268041 RepID=A0ABN6Y346_9MICO|nr:type III polyketide synthase [Frondihabitans sucicola]BDZ51724.1 naringenin-chalcone synthase [Frondihabitans sucicola]